MIDWPLATVIVVSVLSVSGVLRRYIEYLEHSDPLPPDSPTYEICETYSEPFKN